MYTLKYRVYKTSHPTIVTLVIPNWNADEGKHYGKCA